MTLDPRKGADIISSHLHLLLFEGLVRLNEDNTISPAQAKSFTVSDDKTVYTFHLRDTVWSNGMAVTAHDFEKAWKDILNPSFPSLNAHLLYCIKNGEAAKKGTAALDEVGIFAKDSKTLIITLEKPTPYFLNLISFCLFSPVNRQIDIDHPRWAHHDGEHYVCNGPFILKKWKHNDEVVLERNPFYWDQSRSIPDQIQFSRIENEMTALQMFERGEFDMIGGPLSPLPIDALPTLKENGRLIQYPDKGTALISFNIENPPFNHVKIRKAFAYAIDRNAIVENITQMGEYVATSAIPPVLKNHREHSFFKDADTSLARQLLEEGLQELGMTKEVFEELVYYYPFSELNRKIAEVLQQQWQNELGVQIKIQNLDPKILMRKLIRQDYFFAQNLWLAQYDDPMSIFERFKIKENKKNYPNWENEEFSSLLEASFYTSGIKRTEILEKAEEIFLNDMPICPLYHLNIAYIVQPYLNDLGISPIGQLLFKRPTMLAMEKK